MNTHEKTTGRTRKARTLSFTPSQDQWLAELLGERGNASSFFQALVSCAMRGEIDARKLLQGQKGSDALERAATYLKAKEASLHFEEDVASVVQKWVAPRRSLRVVKQRIHNDGTPFVADFSIERDDGTVVCSVACKSSPRADRLQLALAEAMIGNQKTSRPVVTVVPYLLESSNEVVDQFKQLGYALAELRNLPAMLDKVAK
jgi:hypothetical protein